MMGNGNKVINFTTPNGMYYLVIEFCANGTNTELTIQNIQLEESTTATAYEPYYVANDTRVTQIANHTLIARWRPNTYTVTFDANGGNVDTASKTVTYNSIYGGLPTPTRTGYTFAGWNGKNLFDYQEILRNNADTVSQVELNGVQTISWVNGSTANNQSFLQGYFKQNTQYTFKGRMASSKSSNLAIVIVYTDKSNNILLFNDLATNQNNPQVSDANVFYNYTFISDANKTIDHIQGVWHDYETIYIDINSFQIEEGTTATAYEPYYVTSSTPVTQTAKHTLTARWTDTTPPTISLAKETYIEGFDGWTLASGHTVDSNNVLTISTEGSSYFNMYNVGGQPWYITFDAYTTTTIFDANTGGVLTGSSYYDTNYQLAVSQNGHGGNGYATPVPINAWRNDIFWDGYEGYGSQVEYVLLSFSTSPDYCLPTTMIRNFKIHGQLFSSFYDITATASDQQTGIKLIKYAYGTQNKDYFKTNGTQVQGNTFRVTQNGTYTVYAEDYAGNGTVQTIVIDRITN